MILTMSLVVNSAEASPHIENIASASGTGVSSLSFSFTVPSSPNELMIVGISFAQTISLETVSSVKFGSGSSCTSPQNLVNSGSNVQSNLVRTEIWNFTNPSTANDHVCITLSGVVPEIEAGATVMSGTDQGSNPIRYVSTASGTGTDIANTIQSISEDAVVDVVGILGSVLATQQSNQTLLWNENVASVLSGSASAINSTGNSVTMRWTAPVSVSWTSSAVSIRSLLSSQLTETVLLADTVSTSVTKSLSDQIMISDTVSTSVSKSLSDQIMISDTVSTSVTKSLSDQIMISDALTTSVVEQRLLSEQVEISDTASITSAFVRTFSETVGTSDIMDLVKSTPSAQTVNTEMTAGTNTDVYLPPPPPSSTDVTQMGWSGTITTTAPGRIIIDYTTTNPESVSLSSNTVPIASYAHITLDGITNADITSRIITLTYTDAIISALGLDESSLRMYHNTGAPGAAWTDITVSIDTAANTVTGDAPSFSSVAVDGSPLGTASTTSSSTTSGGGSGGSGRTGVGPPGIDNKRIIGFPNDGSSIGVIPHWVKNVTNWWFEGKISDNEFTSFVGYMLDKKIIKINNLSEKPKELMKLPASTKSIAKLWSDSHVSDRYFLGIIKYYRGLGIW